MSFKEKLWFLEQQAKKHRVPIMHPQKAIWLETFICKHKPKTILELGCAIGYSTSILGHKGAKITSVDASVPAIHFAKEYTEYFKIDVHFFHSDCITFLQTCKQKFDVILIDFEKKKYIDVIPFFETLLHKDSIILADNIDNPKCAKYVEIMKTDKRFHSEIIDEGDHLMISRFVK